MWKKAGRIAALIALCVSVLLIIGMTYVFVSTASRLDQRWDINPTALAIPTDAATIERGKYLSETLLLCSGCHESDLGGMDPYQDVPPIAWITTPNITAGGVTSDYRTEDWIRAIRHCVAPDGSPLFIMACQNFSKTTDEDLAAVIAYVRTVPPLTRTSSKTKLYLAGRTLWALGVFELMAAETIDHEAVSALTYDPQDEVQYGGYLAQMSGCTDCHRHNLGGGKIPGTPPDMAAPANISPHADGLGPWTSQQFATVMRTGVRPDGRVLDKMMPWAAYSKMSDRDIDALWAFLRSVPPAEFGSVPM